MQKNYRQYFTQALAGMVEGMGVGSVEAYHNDNGYVKEVWTVTTPATPANATVYSITLYDGDTADSPITVSFTTTSTVRADLAAGLTAAFRANLRASQIASLVNNTTTLAFTHRKDNTPMFVSVGGGGAAPLTVPTTPTTAAAAPTRIPFGVFLTKVAGATPRVLGSITGGSVRLPNSGDALSAICGFARLNTSVQKDVVGEAATAGYEANQLAVDVQRRLGDLSGIWVPTLETSISESDTVYISVASGSKGYAQKTSANSAIDASARANFRSEVVTDINNNRVVLVYANF
jgi:hypothetical protein